MLILAAILAILWLGGVIGGVGSFIHVLLVAAIIVFLYDMLVGRRHHHQM